MTDQPAASGQGVDALVERLRSFARFAGRQPALCSPRDVEMLRDACDALSAARARAEGAEAKLAEVEKDRDNYKRAVAAAQSHPDARTLVAVHVAGGIMTISGPTPDREQAMAKTVAEHLYVLTATATHLAEKDRADAAKKALAAARAESERLLAIAQRRQDALWTIIGICEADLAVNLRDILNGGDLQDIQAAQRDMMRITDTARAALAPEAAS